MNATTVISVSMGAGPFIRCGNDDARCRRLRCARAASIDDPSGDCAQSPSGRASGFRGYFHISAHDKADRWRLCAMRRW